METKDKQPIEYIGLVHTALNKETPGKECPTSGMHNKSSPCFSAVKLDGVAFTQDSSR